MLSENLYLEKVTALITRPGASGLELLLLQHPTAGIQLPGGTVEENEPIEAAVWREVGEETGLTDLRLQRTIGCLEEVLPPSRLVVLHRTRVYSQPESSSFDWAEFRRGIPVQFERACGEFIQVTYREGDRYPDETFTTYQITGWVPAHALTHLTRRHFFHLILISQARNRWSVFSDNHTFEHFWAALNNLPTLIQPQQEYLEYVLFTLGYSFDRL